MPDMFHSGLLEIGNQLSAFSSLKLIELAFSDATCSILQCFTEHYPEVCKNVQLNLTVEGSAPKNFLKFCSLVCPLLPICAASIAWSDFSDESLAALVTNNVRTLQVLRLTQCYDVTDIGLEALHACSELVNLRLEGQRRLSLASAKTIGRLTQLRHLSVRESPSLNNDQALEAYAGLVNLETLCLGRSSCTLTSLWHLTPGLRKLEVESGHVHGVSCYLNLLSKFPVIEMISRGAFIVYDKRNPLVFNL
jgi:hypothetical protein